MRTKYAKKNLVLVCEEPSLLLKAINILLKSRKRLPIEGSCQQKSCTKCQCVKYYGMWTAKKLTINNVIFDIPLISREH